MCSDVPDVFLSYDEYHILYNFKVNNFTFMYFIMLNILVFYRVYIIFNSSYGYDSLSINYLGFLRIQIYGL